MAVESMLHMPTLKIRLKDLGEQLHGMLRLHCEEIEPYIQAGVERALSRIGEDIIDEAARLAAQTVQEEVKAYLTYGARGQAIRAAVARGLAPVVAMLLGQPPEEARDTGPGTSV
jgi:ABC-type histidine transport system ATPase subunit